MIPIYRKEGWELNSNDKIVNAIFYCGAKRIMVYAHVVI